MSRVSKFLERFAEGHREDLQVALREWSAAQEGVTRVADLVARENAAVAGQITALCLRKREGQHALEVTLDDGGDEILLIWTGRHSIPGVEIGARLVAEGTVGPADGDEMSMILNPVYTLRESAPRH